VPVGTDPADCFPYTLRWLRFSGRLSPPSLSDLFFPFARSHCPIRVCSRATGFATFRVASSRVLLPPLFLSQRVYLGELSIVLPFRPLAAKRWLRFMPSRSLPPFFLSPPLVPVGVPRVFYNVLRATFGFAPSAFRRQRPLCLTFALTSTVPSHLEYGRPIEYLSSALL